MRASRWKVPAMSRCISPRTVQSCRPIRSRRLRTRLATTFASAFARAPHAVIPATAPSPARKALRLSIGANVMLSLVAHEGDVDLAVDHAGLDAARQESPNCLTATDSIIQRPVVDIHANERIGHAAVQAARILHGMVERSAPMLEPKRYAGV